MQLKTKRIIQTVLLLCFCLVAGNLQAQTVTKGTVTDSSGEPVIGATVTEKGNPQNATVTDFDGNFSLKESHRCLLYRHEAQDCRRERQVCRQR